MASSIISGLLVSALFLLFAALAPAANGLNLTVSGQICCASGGICSGGAPPAVGAALTLTCPASFLVGPINATTGADGSFFINTSTLPGVTVLQVLGNMLTPCTLQVQLSQTSCPQQIPVGTQTIVSLVQFLRVIFTATGTTVQGFVLGLIAL